MIKNIRIIEEIDMKMTRFTFGSKINTIRKLSHIIDWNYSEEFMTSYVFPDMNIKGHEKYNFLRQHIYCHELEYLSLISIINNESKSYNFDFNCFKTFKTIINLYKDYQNPILIGKKKIDSEDINHFFVKTAFQQFPSQLNYIYQFLKYNYFFTYIDNEINMDEKFIDEFLYPFDQYVQLVMTIYLISNKTLYQPFMEFESDLLVNILKFPKEKVIKMYTILGISRDKFIEEYQLHNTKEYEMKIYDYNPLKKYPMIYENSSWYIPIPYMLFQAITEGMFHRIMDVENVGEFKNKFGKNVFEKYLEKVLNKGKDNFIIIPEFEYKKGQKSPDFILVNGGNLIIIEAKSAMPTLKIRYGNEEEYRYEIRKTYKKALEQCIKKDKLIREKVIKNNNIPENINKIYYLIVTPESYYISPNDSIRELLLQDSNTDIIKDGKNKKFHFISCDELENLLEGKNESIFELLEKLENGTYNWGDYINTYIIKPENANSESYKYFMKLFSEVRKNIQGKFKEN